MATISSLGTGSGLELNTLLTSLMTAEQAPMLELKKKEASSLARISSLGSLKSALSALQTAAYSMSPGTSKATVADAAIANATADSTSTTASYSLTVSKLAKAQTLGSEFFALATTPLAASGTLKIEFGQYTSAPDFTPPFPPRELYVTIEASATLTDIKNAINENPANVTNHEVTASIVTVAGSSQLVLTSQKTGTASVMRLSGLTGADATKFNFNPEAPVVGTLAESAAASNAAFTLNGVAGSGTSNTLTSLIQGVTLNLTKETATPTTINVNNDVISKFITQKATVADSTIASATAEPGAAASSYSLTVTNLAQAHRLVTPGYGTGSSASTTIGTGSLKIEFGTIAGAAYAADAARTKTITIDSSNNTLGGLRDAINASGADMTASIVVGSAGAQLVLTGKQTGSSSVMQLSGLAEFDYTPTGSTTDTLLETAGGQQAKDAVFTINGIAGSSKSNTVTGMIEGVTLNLTKETTTPTTFTVSNDNTTKLTAALTSFVSAYNSAATTMSTLGAYNITTKVAGALQGNSTLRNAQSMVRNQLFNITGGGNSAYQRLSDIGVSVGKDGTLSLDTTKLNSAISADFSSVARMVSKAGSAFQTTYTALAGTNGTITSAISGANSLIANNTKDQARLTLRLNAIETRYRAQFTSLDTLIAGMKSTSTYLTTQLTGLANLNAALSK
ncbi:flagellar filament capping protein FliD [Propionivibrio sp.]|uniref:flagellar filament capping protein FliD n=1 Tax=Propionivibrio sp. TaxID=2212460 RepID=UPI003BF3163B